MLFRRKHKELLKAAVMLQKTEYKKETVDFVLAMLKEKHHFSGTIR